MHPLIGRSVFYSGGGLIRPGTVVEVDSDGACYLHVLEPRATPNGHYYILAHPITEEDASVGEIGFFTRENADVHAPFLADVPLPEVPFGEPVIETPVALVDEKVDNEEELK